MTSSFNDSTKQITDELITMSTVLDKKMEKWAEVFTRHPDSQNAGVCAGFISNQTTVNRIEMILDVLAQSSTGSGILRARAIASMHDENDNERFDNVSLEYAVNLATAEQLVAKGNSITRQDIQHLVHADDSQLKSVVISDETGKDSKSQELLGKRYSLEANELAIMSAASEAEFMQAMNTVLARLKRTAASEAK